MTKSTRNQSEYTRLFLQAAGMDDQEDNIDHWIGFWSNNIKSNHLRLSKFGVKFLIEKTKIPVHIIELSHPILAKHLIDLTRVNLGPYYIHKDNTLYVLDDQVASMLMLHAGNLDQYLANYKLG